MALIEPKNQFANHVIFWMLGVPFLGILLLPAFLEPKSLILDASEKLFFHDVLGRDLVAITSQTESIFKYLFVDTGIFAGMKSLLGGGEGNSLGHFYAFASKLSSSYNTAFWLLIYRAIWRVCALWPALLSIFLCLGIPSLVDGLSIRARKSFTFEFHNPVYFWTSSHLLVLVLGLAVVLPLLPIAMTGVLIGVFCLILCTTIWTTAANFQTGN